MSVRVTIETASKEEAELIAQRLPVKATAESWRGFGVIRVGAKDKEETKTSSTLSRGLPWSTGCNGHACATTTKNASSRPTEATAGRSRAVQSTGRGSGSARPAMR